MLDRGPGTGGAWQFRWEALRLGYAHKVHDLPGMDELGVSFDTADKSIPAKDVVADYYARYEEHYGFQVVRPADVTKVETTARRLHRRLRGRLTAPRQVSTLLVVNATGTWGAPFVPYYPGMNEFRGRHLHTSEYRDAEEFRGQNVVVVGGGTSAIGFLMELEEVAESLTWVARRPIEFLDQTDLNIEGGVSAVALQDEAAREGRALPSIVSTTGVPRSRRIQAAIDRGLLKARPMFSSIEPDGVRWSNGAFQTGGCHHLVDRLPARAAPPRPAQAAREERRHRRRQERLVEEPAHLLRGLRADGIHDRRQPRGSLDRPPGGRDAQHARRHAGAPRDRTATGKRPAKPRLCSATVRFRRAASPSDPAHGRGRDAEPRRSERPRGDAAAPATLRWRAARSRRSGC